LVSGGLRAGDCCLQLLCSDEAFETPEGLDQIGRHEGDWFTAPIKPQMLVQVQRGLEAEHEAAGTDAHAGGELGNLAEDGAGERDVRGLLEGKGHGSVGGRNAAMLEGARSVAPPTLLAVLARFSSSVWPHTKTAL